MSFLSSLTLVLFPSHAPCPPTIPTPHYRHPYTPSISSSAQEHRNDIRNDGLLAKDKCTHSLSIDMTPINRPSSLLGSTSTTRATGLAFLLLITMLLAQAPSSVNAHIRMASPLPLRAPNHPDYDESSFDYSMTNPLLEDGS